ncbi:hypothetical protein CGZ80_09380 [Rhodopirellula sp. MGV]|nr:hypothetical protein CGZ80_09380 [Rhodopirellula sp. MGV]
MILPIPCLALLRDQHARFNGRFAMFILQFAILAIGNVWDECNGTVASAMRLMGSSGRERYFRGAKGDTRKSAGC